jgi:bacteriorhodopsin
MVEQAMKTAAFVVSAFFNCGIASFAFGNVIRYPEHANSAVLVAGMMCSIAFGLDFGIFAGFGQFYRKDGSYIQGMQHLQQFLILVVKTLIIPVLRWVAWLLTTPLIQYNLYDLAGASMTYKLCIMALDAEMIVFGFASVMAENLGFKLAFFISTGNASLLASYNL